MDEASSVVSRPRKHRENEERSGVLVSGASEGQRDGVSRGCRILGGHGLSGLISVPIAILSSDRGETPEQYRRESVRSPLKLLAFSVKIIARA